MFEAKNSNAITTAISKSMDFDYFMPEELKEHRENRERYKDLAQQAAKKHQSKHLQDLSKRLTGKLNNMV